MAHLLMGIKRGMIQLFDDKGNIVPCTVIHVEPNVVTQVKTVETDGYNALQLAAGKVVTKDPRTVENRVSKPLRGHFAKAKVEPRRHLRESVCEKTEGVEAGQEITVAQFTGITHVDISARSKGKGYQGVMKLHGYAGGPAAHGSSFHRHAGSTGNRSTPGRCFPGGKRASHMGDDNKTIQNLRIVQIDEAENVLIVEGAVPGARGSLVTIEPAVKRYPNRKSR